MKTKRFLLLIIIAIFFLYLAAMSKSEVILISNAEQLVSIKDNPHGSFALIADIELPTAWAAIDFYGRFDGREHTIRGGELSVGLFGHVENAVIENLVLEDFTIKIPIGKTDFTGILAQEISNSQITNITIKNGNIRSTSSVGAVGGLAGSLDSCTVSSITVDVVIDVSADFTGGLAGIATDTCITDSKIKSGTLKGGKTIGGFIGHHIGQSLINDCHSSADVVGETAGGFIGKMSGKELPANANHKVEVTRSSSTGNVTSCSGYAGGFVGEVYFASITECGAYGNVSGGAKNGGFVAGLYDNSRVIYSYAKGDVFEGEIIGGFCGVIANGACIELAYSTGSVISKEIGVSVGGFVGMIAMDGAPNTITGCLSFAPWVTGVKDGNVGRFAGHMEHNGVNSCYSLLGSMVVSGDELIHALSSAYGADGKDMSMDQVEEVAYKLGWRIQMLQ